MFIQYLQTNPQFYVMVVVSVVISIVLHELAHGWMAMRVGDDTPYHTGHMTGNPIVHMGGFSLLALFLSGIAWGQMPVDPTRFRGRYAEALVSGAGPATNLLLAVLALSALGIWTRQDVREANARFEASLKQLDPNDPQVERLVDDALEPPQHPQWQENARQFLLIFGSMNVVLFLFNLLPVPPLDGSTILANFHRGYATFIRERASPALLMCAFAVAFLMSETLVVWAQNQSLRYIHWIAYF